MEYFLTGVAVILALGVHFAWRRRFRVLEQRLEQEAERFRVLEEDRRNSSSREKARQEALFDNMFEGVLLLDGQDRVLLFNEALQNLLRVGPEIEGRTLMEAFLHHDLKVIANRARAEGQVIGVELDLPGADRCQLQVNATAIRPSAGQTEGLVLIFHDVTRLKELENTRQEFVANVSHELRTPLSMIKGYVETLLDGASEDPAVRGKFLRTIQKHSDRLTFLIEDLLTISRLESGQNVLNMEDLPLRPFVNRVIEDLESKARKKHVELICDVPAGIGVRADLERLQQVFVNLLDNAIKYGRENGKVRIGVHGSHPDEVEVRVQDDGPGIPPEALDRVFERFYCVDRARSREQGGTGLGLSIVKHIVRSHGGDVWARSEPGKGATFYFTLPTARNGA